MREKSGGGLLEAGLHIWEHATYCVLWNHMPPRAAFANMAARLSCPVAVASRLARVSPQGQGTVPPTYSCMTVSFAPGGHTTIASTDESAREMTAMEGYGGMGGPGAGGGLGGGGL